MAAQRHAGRRGRLSYFVDKQLPVPFRTHQHPQFQQHGRKPAGMGGPKLYGGARRRTPVHAVAHAYVCRRGGCGGTPKVLRIAGCFLRQPSACVCNPQRVLRTPETQYCGRTFGSRRLILRHRQSARLFLPRQLHRQFRIWP